MSMAIFYLKNKKYVLTKTLFLFKNLIEIEEMVTGLEEITTIIIACT